jgi:predicted metal-dependent hydrolase
VNVPVGDDAAARAALRRWLSRAAKTHLVPMLEAISAEERLPFSHATVRAQRSRWGSCSRAGAISLNRSLLFLTPEMARCVMVHELVHTLRHDHSPAFWALLRDRVPDVDRVRRELRQAWRRVPAWAEAE